MEYHKTSRTWLIRDKIIFIFVLLGKSAKETLTTRMYIVVINLSGLLRFHEVSAQYHEILEMQRRQGRKKKKSEVEFWT